jgi:hypothetical protein
MAPARAPREPGGARDARRDGPRRGQGRVLRRGDGGGAPRAVPPRRDGGGARADAVGARRVRRGALRVHDARGACGPRAARGARARREVEKYQAAAATAEAAYPASTLSISATRITGSAGRAARAAARSRPSASSVGHSRRHAPSDTAVCEQRRPLAFRKARRPPTVRSGKRLRRSGPCRRQSPSER